MTVDSFLRILFYPFSASADFQFAGMSDQIGIGIRCRVFWRFTAVDSFSMPSGPYYLFPFQTNSDFFDTDL